MDALSPRFAPQPTTNLRRFHLQRSPLPSKFNNVWDVPAMLKSSLCFKTLVVVVFLYPLGNWAADFATRCADPNVVRCHGFEADTRFNVYEGQFSMNYTFDHLIGDSNQQAMFLDTELKASGESSLRADYVGNSDSDVSGSFVVRFSDDGQTQFGLNEEFFIQWRQRFSPEVIRRFDSTKYSGGSTWKQIIIGAGDVYAGTVPQRISWSCTILEIVAQANVVRRSTGADSVFPSIYHSCGNYTYMDYTNNDAGNVVLQHQGPPYCLYPNDPQGGCFNYVANEWMTFQIRVKIGSRWGPEYEVNTSGTGSRIQFWAARENQSSVLLFDSLNVPRGYAIVNDPDDLLKYGKVWLTPYTSFKDPQQAHAPGKIWYDDLIISTKKIADPTPGGGSGDELPAPTALQVR